MRRNAITRGIVHAQEQAPQRERTHDGQRIQQYMLWPEQHLYEKIRSLVLFNASVAERARETGTAERTLQRKADLFESSGMDSTLREKYIHEKLP